jgi:hypothetical protein
VYSKGQLILKYHFDAFKSPKKNKKISRISALASKKRSSKKIRALYAAIWRILF